MGASWVWLPASLTGGSGGGAYSKLFRGDSLSTTDLLAREVLQNSWDAALSHQSRQAPMFEFRFRFVSLNGAEKANFIAATDLAAISERRKALGDSRDWPRRATVDELLDLELPLRLLYLEDYATHGMYGDPDRISGSHLYKALYDLGTTSKDNESAGTGGSFGFGKSAFIASSAVRIAIVHTRFEKSPDDDADQRLIGFTWWGSHQVDDLPFGGRAMFGSHRSEAWMGASPLTNDEAAALASSLGMPPRSASEDDRGSTVMLISPEVSPDDLVDAVERYWWPALEDGLMSVTVEKDDGTELRPHPRRSAKLRPFLQAYGIASGTKTPGNSQEERLASAKWRADSQGTKHGRLALVIDREYASSPALEDVGVGDMSTPTVALIRDPRMVIEYKSFSSRLPIRGVYIADPSIDHNLREVEPPAHTTWDNTGSHDVSDRSREIAQGVLSRIRRSVREFAAEFAPPPTAVSTDLPLFGDLLSRYMGGKASGPKPTPPGGPKVGSRQLVRVYGQDARELQGDDSVILERRIAIRIPKDDRWDGATLSGVFTASIAQDLSGSASDPVEIDVALPPGFVTDEAGTGFRGGVNPGDEYLFTIRTAPFPRHQSIIITPTTHLLQASDLRGKNA
jgi:hypothetical protein